MQSTAKTVEEYFSSLPADRREAIKTVYDVIKKNIPAGYEEVMNWGMISWEIPLSRYPVTYNKHPLAYVALANQKNYMAIYLMGLYAKAGEEEDFREVWAKTGKKLDMGKSCIRFKKLDELALDLIAETVAAVNPDEYIEIYETARGIK